MRTAAQPATITTSARFLRDFIISPYASCKLGCKLHL
jgi:hypothetical protein